MTTFAERNDLKNIKVTSQLLSRIAAVHSALQQIEAGMEASDLMKAKATFEFFELFGLYPKTASLLGRNLKLDGLGLEMQGGYYRVVGFVKNPIPELREGEYLPTNSVGMFGPGSAYSKRSLPTWAEVEAVIKAAFPKAVITASAYESDSSVTLNHISVRSQFMQGHGDGFPVPSGTATCSHESIALMQAAVRMLHVFVVDAHGQNTYEEMRGYHEEAKKTRLGMMYGMGAQKYGERQWEEGAKRLLAAMFPKKPAPTLVELANRMVRK